MSLAVLYPAEGEVIEATRCRVLIAAPAPGVEIAVDGEAWRSCRKGDGYWWFDWSGLAPGRHQALVRCEGARGREPFHRTCRFLVSPPAAVRSPGTRPSF